MSSVLNTVISLVRTPSMFIAIIAFWDWSCRKKVLVTLLREH